VVARWRAFLNFTMAARVFNVLARTGYKTGHRLVIHDITGVAR